MQRDLIDDLKVADLLENKIPAMEAQIEDLTHDAELMRRLKRELKGIDAHLVVHDKPIAYTVPLCDLWRQIKLEANQEAGR